MRPKVRHLSDAVTAAEEAAPYGSPTLKRERGKRVDLDEIQWTLDDAEQDGKALIKLSTFLSEHGYRKRASSCDDAIETIRRLEREVARLKGLLAKRS